jgi:hypothetical protein
MMSNTRIVWAVLFLLAVPCIAGCTSSAEVTEADMTRAGDALTPLKKELFQALTWAMNEGGPERAMEVCQLRAPEITQLASTDGAVIGRTSHRVRNPQNKPEPWMEVFLNEYLANPADNEPRAIRLSSGEIGYVEPIYTKGLCLQCHGNAIDSTVQVRLHELYPDDQATGFEEGDLRGMFWVKLPAT